MNRRLLFLLIAVFVIGSAVWIYNASVVSAAEWSSGFSIKCKSDGGIVHCTRSGTVRGQVWHWRYHATRTDDPPAVVDVCINNSGVFNDPGGPCWNIQKWFNVYDREDYINYSDTAQYKYFVAQIITHGSNFNTNNHDADFTYWGRAVEITSHSVPSSATVSSPVAVSWGTDSAAGGVELLWDGAVSCSGTSGKSVTASGSETCTAASSAGTGYITIRAHGPSDPDGTSTFIDSDKTISVTGGGTHLECVSNACTAVAGAGANTGGCTSAGQSCQSGAGRNKCVNSTCVFDPNDSGNDQCSPVGSACGGSVTQCNPPLWNNWHLDACWDVRGSAGGEDCSNAGQQRAADWWCSQGPACSGTGATNYSTVWTPGVGTKYASTARVCPSCSFNFTNITCGRNAPSTPTISNLPACSDSPYQATISWSGQPDPSSGFYIDISDNPNFSSFYNKQTLISTQTDTTNFKGIWPAQDQTLTLRPNTAYYTRVYNGSHSPVASWSVPSCRHNVCQVVNNAALCASVSGQGANECNANADCPPPPPLCDFSINPARVTVPATSTLAWSCTNADPQGCSIDQGVGSNLPPSGSRTVNPPASITYTLACTGPSGNTTSTVSVRAFRLEGGALKEIPPQ